MRKLSPLRHVVRPLAAAAVLLCSIAASQAIVLGASSGLGAYMVRVVGFTGKPNCSGVVIDRMHVVTAAHCGPRAIEIDGVRIPVARLSQTVKLEDGRIINVRGDAVIMSFRQALPASASPIEIGQQGTDGSFTIAGFGATVEAQRGTLGALHEASVVHLGPFRLVDPRRDSDLSASACYGDSGGAVLRNGALIGIITRASHPHPSKACGHLTHYAPVVANVFAAPPTANAVSAVENPLVPAANARRTNRAPRAAAAAFAQFDTTPH